MEHKNETIGGDRTVTRRLKVTGQNVRLADPVIGEKAIGGLGVGPILANQRNALRHGAPELRQQFSEPLVQTLVREAAASKLAIKPCARRPVHWHRAPQRFGARQGITNDSYRAIACVSLLRLYTKCG